MVIASFLFLILSACLIGVSKGRDFCRWGCHLLTFLMATWNKSFILTNAYSGDTFQMSPADVRQNQDKQRTTDTQIPKTELRGKILF